MSVMATMATLPATTTPPAAAEPDAAPGGFTAALDAARPPQPARSATTERPAPGASTQREQDLDPDTHDAATLMPQTAPFAGLAVTPTALAAQPAAPQVDPGSSEEAQLVPGLPVSSPLPGTPASAPNQPGAAPATPAIANGQQLVAQAGPAASQVAAATTVGQAAAERSAVSAAAARAVPAEPATLAAGSPAAPGQQAHPSMASDATGATASAAVTTAQGQAHVVALPTRPAAPAQATAVPERAPQVASAAESDAVRNTQPVLRPAILRPAADAASPAPAAQPAPGPDAPTVNAQEPDVLSTPGDTAAQAPAPALAVTAPVPASLNPAAASAPSHVTVATPVPVAQLPAQIVAHGVDRTGRLTLRLDPAELGPVQVTIARGQDGLHVTVRAEAAAHAQLGDLERSLRSQLASAGLDLSGFTLSNASAGFGQTRDQHEGYADRQEQAPWSAPAPSSSTRPGAAPAPARTATSRDLWL